MATREDVKRALSSFSPLKKPPNSLRGSKLIFGAGGAAGVAIGRIPGRESEEAGMMAVLTIVRSASAAAKPADIRIAIARAITLLFLLMSFFFLLMMPS